MATSNELTRIADAVNALRPDWIARSVRVILNRPELRDRAFADLAVIMTVIACDPKSTTPARAVEPGPWWQAVKANAGVSSVPEVGPGRDVDRCERAGHEHEAAATCRACRAEQLADLEPDAAPQRAVPAPAEFREAIPARAVRPHGGGRDFGQTSPISAPEDITRCSCGAAFIDSRDGRASHDAVFGHHPQAAAERSDAEL
jgi:hypothetical protein